MQFFAGAKDGLFEPNVPSDWREAGAWRKWSESPLNLIRGEAHYQAELERSAGKARPGGWLVPVAVSLRREPTNPHDENAIQSAIDGRVVGYVAKEVAATLAQLLDQHPNREFSFAGLIRGGWREGSDLGVHLWLRRRISPGPALSLDGLDAYAVAWPPAEDEGVPSGPLG